MLASLITSRTNPLIKELRALAQHKTRQARGEFLVEGIQPVLQALASDAWVRMIVVAPDLLKSEIALERIEQQERKGTRIVRVSPQVFETFAEREHPTGLAAVVKISPRSLEDLQITENSIFVALYEVSNPGNLGTILRTADAVNAGGVIVLGAATDPYAPTVVKASRGALFTIPLMQLDSIERLLDWCKSKRVQVYTTSGRAGQTLWETEFRAPCVFILGNEGEGLPERILNAGQAVRIPMRGTIDSLNLAVAAGVLLYEAVRQMRTTG
ncbi:MAG TPA: RNA methyltransferase [Anaerolineae bacterium]|nr:RNA methyltransferase [Anaerolineae bacterium]